MFYSAYEVHETALDSLGQQHLQDPICGSFQAVELLFPFLPASPLLVYQKLLAESKPQDLPFHSIEMA